MQKFIKGDAHVNEEPGQQLHDYCLLVDLVTKATECFNGAFSKVDIYLANELCFEKVSATNPIPVRNIDFYMNREKLLDKEGTFFLTFYYSAYFPLLNSTQDEYTPLTKLQCSEAFVSVSIQLF